MQNLQLVGRTGLYVTAKELEDNKIQYVFTVYANNGKDNEGTGYRCILSGNKNSIKKLADNLFIEKEVTVNEEGKKSVKHHSRLVAINGNLAISTRAQLLPVVGLEGEFEEVMAMDVTVFVNSIEFLDANPGKKETKDSSEDNISTDERAKRRADLKAKKESMLNEALEKECK